MTHNQQRSDLIAAQRRVWGDDAQECATRDCSREAAPFSCYCRPCEDAMDENGNE